MVDALCLARIWSFHLLYAVALAPLFVKVWRMWRLVGQKHIRRSKMPHWKTALYMLPIVGIQFMILLVEHPRNPDSLPLEKQQGAA